jgi:hypothetical protein
MIMAFTKALYKYQVAGILQISNSTLSRWLNCRYFDQLASCTGYEKSQKLLNPKQLNYLSSLLDLSNEN